MNEGLTPELIHSFAKNRGHRGVHFYDINNVEFMPWDQTMAKLDKLPEKFGDKLVEAMANYDPDEEFVAVSAGNGQLTVELFKVHSV